MIVGVDPPRAEQSLPRHDASILTQSRYQMQTVRARFRPLKMSQQPSII